MSACPDCGFELERDARFCGGCGTAVRPTAEPVEGRPDLTVRFDASRPLEQGMAVLPLALRPAGGPLRNIELTLTSVAWTTPRDVRLPALEPGRETVIQVAVEPRNTGETMFGLRLTAVDEQGLPHCFSGEGGPIVVVTPGSAPSGPSIEVESEGAFVGDLSDMAGAGTIKIKSEGMVVLNMDQYEGSRGGRKARWESIPLIYDERRAADLRQVLRSSRRCPYCFRLPDGAAEACVRCGIPLPSYTAKTRNRLGAHAARLAPIVDLKLHCLQTQRDHLVFTGNIVRLGRMRLDPRTGKRANDVVLRLYPETDRNQERTLLLSRHQARMRVERERVRLRFLKSTPLGDATPEMYEIGDGSVVPFLEEMSLRFRLAEAVARKHAGVEVEGEARAGRFLRSCAFRREDDYGPLELYLLLRREAELVLNSQGRLRWCEAGDPLLRLVREEQRIWVEDFAGRGDVWVGPHRVGEDELVVLEPGALLRAGEFSFEVSRHD